MDRHNGTLIALIVLLAYILVLITIVTLVFANLPSEGESPNPNNCITEINSVGDATVTTTVCR